MTRGALINFGSTFRGSGAIPGARFESLDSLKNGVASQGSIVYVDLGQNSGVKPGDILIVHRPVEIDSRLYGDSPGAKKVRTQRTAIGELVVLKVGEAAATALVTYASAGLATGDYVSRR